MSDKPVAWWRILQVRLKFWVAYLVMRWCGPAVIYWTAPEEWERYMQTGLGKSIEEAVG